MLAGGAPVVSQSSPDDEIISTNPDESLIENEVSLFTKLCIEDDENSEEMIDYCFIFKEGNHLISTWNALVTNGVLYLEPPDAEIPAGCREGFVCLLDYAEETLKVSSVIVCASKDDDVSSRLRTFMFLGFQIIHHTTCVLAPKSDCYVYMVYGFE